MPVGDVELRRHRLAGLADLERVRVPTGVDGGTRRAHGSAERVGQGLDLGEVATGATATGDDDRGLGELGTTGRFLGFDETILAPLAASDTVTERPRLCRGRSALRSSRVRLDRDDRRALGDLGLDGVAAGEHRLGGDVPSACDVDRVGDEAGVRLQGQTGGDLLALRWTRSGSRPGSLSRRAGRAPRPSGRRGSPCLPRRRARRPSRRRTSDRRRPRRRPGRRAEDDRGRLAEAPGDGQELQRRLGGLAIHVVDQNENFRHHGLVLLSDELLGGEELDELLGAAVLVGDDLAGGARRARLVSTRPWSTRRRGRPGRRRGRGRRATRSRAASSWRP